MKKKLIQTITQGNNTFGQVSNPQDVMKTQDFLHERVNDLTHDFLNSQKPFEIFGFTYALGVGNAFNITINKSGRIYSQSGVQYELIANTTLLIPQADLTLPRLDLVVAVLEDDVDTELALVPFVRLRSSQEFATSVPAYAPQNLEAATEKHFRAVVQIKKGTPAATPTVPTVNSNEVPLYLIVVAPNAAAIRNTDVKDLRDVSLSLRHLSDLSKKSDTNFTQLQKTVEELSKLGDFPADFGRLFGEHTTLKQILQQLKLQSSASRDLPDIRYDNPKVPLTNPDSSKIIATGAVDGATPVVNVEIGGRINFGDTDVILQPDRFPTSVNAHFEKIAGSAANASNEQAINLGNVTLVDSDGDLDFAVRAAVFGTPRARPAAAARDHRFIEIFGGLAQDNNSLLSDWLTYDLINDTLTERNALFALQPTDRPAAIPFGDGTHVLLIGGNSNTNTPPAYKVNAATGVGTAITTTRPTGKYFFGDLIAAGKIFIVAVGNQTNFWEFDTATNQFTQLGTTGNIPICLIDYCSGCFLSENLFVLQTFEDSSSSSGKTYIFNRTNLEWTRINIAQPYADSANDAPINSFRMANVNGSPVIVGGLLYKGSDTSKARLWELRQIGGDPNPNRKTYEWRSWDASYSPIQNAGLCSAIETGLPRGNAVMIAGQNSFSKPQQYIFESVQSGLIFGEYRGEPGVTVADSSTFAQFLIPVYQADWDVAGYLLSFRGQFDESNLKTEVSFDNGATFIEIKPDKYAAIANSSAPGIRHLRITLYNLKSSKKPILSKLFEVFDQDGIELENRVVIQYDAPNTTKALYVDSFGVITLSDIIEPSAPGKCLLHKVTPNGSGAPILKNYINRRRPHIKYSKVKTAAAPSTQFDNELAVPARYVDCRAYKADSNLYHLPDVTPAFDSTVNVTGVATNGDTWIVELEG